MGARVARLLTRVRAGLFSIGARVATLLAQLRADISFAFVDAMVIAFAYMSALGILSLDQELAGVWWARVAVALPVIIGVHLLANVAMGAYGHVWEYASISEARRVIAASFWAGSVLLLATLALGDFDIVEGPGDRPVPLSVLVLGSLISLGFLGAVRFRSRLFSFHRGLKLDARDRVLILGTSRRAVDLARSAPNEVDVIGFVSSGPTPKGKRLANLPIVGELEDIASLVTMLNVQQVIVASEGASVLARRLVDLCVDVDVRLRIVPDLDELLTGYDGGPDIRDLEIEDLLLRPTVSTDLDAVESILYGKRVLVTGAGGSIGSEIVSQVLRFMPDKVVAMDNDETHLHDNMVKWEAPAGTELIPALCDIRDKKKLNALIKKYRPQVIYHAAAHKHVPILEEWPEEAVKTNVVGTNNLLKVTRELGGVERFVLISTDKTVEPKGVMGASKRMAEMLVQSASDTETGGCIYSAVRFGNVLGSRGSVVPTFMEQIRNGGPVTITDERMTRYFMTIAEAVQLVLQASALAEHGEVFVLDMGQPVRIIDLAHRMIRLGGLVPGRDIEVKTVGARPGEKLVEELATGPLLSSSHPQINIAETDVPGPDILQASVKQLKKMSSAGGRQELKEMLLALANRRAPEHMTIDLREEISEVNEVNQWT
jgi:FlaA1/EpsC-like NDP-sugar epimerase